MKRTQTSIAKITRPKITSVYERKRLFKLLDHGLERPVVWISAPAGSGKTTLAASYLDARKRPCLWYQMDEGDSDSATFFYYMGLAGKNAAPRVKHPLPLLTPEYIGGVPVFSRRYFENLCARLTSPFALVFDNYHAVPLESTFHEVFREGLCAVPDDIDVIVISRADPPPAFSTLLAENRMTVVGWDDVRLTSEETGGIARIESGSPLRRGVVEKLHEKACGWTAGLILLLKSMKNADFAVDTSGCMTNEEVFRYFGSQLFDKADADIQNFLLTTAVLPSIGVSVAEKLTGNRQAGQLLDRLSRSNTFTEKRRDPLLTYQYHPLFRDFLLTRMQEAFTPTHINRLRKQAGKLLEESGRIEDAAELYRDAGEWDALDRIVVQNAPALMRQGRNKTLEAWIAEMPKELLEKNPWLLYWRGMSIVHYRPMDSVPILEHAFEKFSLSNDENGVFLSWSGVVDAIMLQYNRLDRLDRWLNIFHQKIKVYKKIANPEVECRVGLSMFSLLLQRMPSHPDTFYWRERASSLVSRHGDMYLQAQLLFHTAWHEMFVGKLRRASEFLADMKKQLEKSPPSPFMRIMLGLVSFNYWFAGKHESFQEAVTECLHIADESGVRAWEGLILGAGVSSALGMGDIRRAEELLGRMKSAHLYVSEMDKSYYCFLAAWYEVTRRDFTSALHFAQQGMAFADQLGLPFARAVNYLGVAIVYHKLSEYALSRKFWLKARKIAEDMRPPAVRFMCYTAKAEFDFDLGKELSGLEALRSAFAVGREQGYVNMYWWRQDVMARLCAKALEHGIEVDYVRGLIRKRNLIPPSPPFAKGGMGGIWMDSWPWPVKICTLGQFRIERGGKPLRSPGKVQKKPLEMLKALIAFGGSDVQGEQIATALWPDADGDAAYKAFGITLIRLRELLGVKDAVQLSEGNVTLDQRYFWVDTWAFEHMLESSPDENFRGQAAFGVPRIETFEGGLRSESNAKRQSAIGDRKSEMDLSMLEKAINLYKGPFLGAESAAWAISLRERLRDKFLRCISAAGMYWEQKKALDKAIDCYKKGLEADDLVEEFYRRIIICYRRLGRNAEALSAYNRCKKTLTSYGIELSSETRALLKKD